MKLLDALRNASDELESKFQSSKLFTHPGEIGSVREEIISDLIRPFLPECYGLGSGQIFSSEDEMSKQIDIVIYDSIYSNVLFKNQKANLFPCESVYGEIEVKSHLSTEELIKSLDNIESMKKLSREDSKTLDITPLYELKIGAGLTCDSSKRNNYLGIIFGFDGLELKTLADKLDEELKHRDKKYMPDFIFCYKKGYMILKMDASNKLVGIQDEFSHYAVIYCNKDIIPMMFLTINTCLNQIRLKAPDYNQYWIKTLENIQKQTLLP